MAYGSQSRYLWTDDRGIVHVIMQGEGGEQGDALMPALFSLGLAEALREAQANLLPDELVIAYLDDLYIVSSPERARTAYDMVTRIIQQRCGIQPNLGKTVCWSKQGGNPPPGIAELGTNVWKGNGSESERGIRVLGAPLGTADFTTAFCAKRIAETRQFCQSLLACASTQHSWLLMYYCLAPRFNHLLRQTPPDLVKEGAMSHDAAVAKTLSDLLGIQGELNQQAAKQAKLPARRGGLGLRDSVRTSPAAYWASWADVLPKLCQRFPGLNNLVVARLLQQEAGEGTNEDVHCLAELHKARETIAAETGLLPTWSSIVQGVTAPELSQDEDDPEDADPADHQKGWQFKVASARDAAAYSELLRTWPAADTARLRSCSGRNNSRWLTIAPTSEGLRIRNAVWQCLLRRRLGLPITPVPCRCEATSCRQQLDAYGHHRSACTRTGRIHGRHASALGAWRQILTEAGYRVHTERLLRNTNVATQHSDQRRMDLIAAPSARGVGARQGTSLFCDLTIVSPITARGAARAGAASHNGVTLERAVNRKRRTYADVATSEVASLVVLGCETYGSWCADASELISELARLQAASSPPYLRKAAKAAWENRWWGLAGVAAQRAIGEALLCPAGADLLPGGTEETCPTLMELLDLS